MTADGAADGWKEVSVADIAAPGNNSTSTGPFGSAIGSRFFRTSGVPVIRGGNLSSDSGVRLRDADWVYLTPAKASEFERSKVRNGDLVFTCWGTINQVGLIDRRATDPEYVISNKQMKLTPDHRRVSSEFLYFLFSGPELQREIVEGSIGSSIPGFNLTRLRSMRIKIPELLNEQRAIAAALTEIHDLIAELERLLEKKEAIKQGMMQRLLTGRTRLAGFDEPWRSLHVASNSTLKARIGWQGLATPEYRRSGEYRLVGGTEFVDGSVDWESTPFVDKWRYDQDTFIQLRDGDVLLTKDGTIGKTAFVTGAPGPATLNSGVFVIRPLRDSYNSHFLYFMLRSRAFEEFLTRLSAGSTISHLYQRDLVGLVLDIPPTRQEQVAIANVLADTEAEATQVRARLLKTRLLKQGMMQHLLTGRTRLPVEEAAA